MNPWRRRLGHLIHRNGGVRPRGSFYNDQRVEDSNSAWQLASTESYAVHLMKAVTAVVRGLDAYMFEIRCDDKTRCDKMLNFQNTEEKYEKIKNAEIPNRLPHDPNQDDTERVFRDSGNGNVGFTVFRIDKESENLYEYDVLTTIPVENEEIVFVNTPTFYDDGVAVSHLNSGDGSCHPTTAPSITTTTTSDGLNTTTIALIAVVVVLAVIGLAVGLACYILRLRG